MSKEEFDKLLEEGWRRFGLYFFRPKCEKCSSCIPIRINVNDFSVTRSQKRVINKNKETKVIFNKLKFSDEMFEIYKEHSKDRFDQKTEKKDFLETFFYESVPAIQSEYYVGEKLIGVGFIDITNQAFSSVYFFYRTFYNHLSLGIYSVIKEIEYAKSLKLNYYYLGYFVRENKKMSYKNQFYPHELYEWQDKKWFAG